MCFYNGIDISRAEHIKLKNIQKEIGHYKEALHRPMQSGFSYAPWPVIKPTEGGRNFTIVLMHWEFIPFYIRTQVDLHHFRHGGINSKTGKKDPPRNTLNAIGEEMLEKVSYKQAAVRRRCLVLSSGFYEWRHHIPAGTKKDIAYPYHIVLPGHEYFFMAGIWQPWTDQETGETLDTFAIVTTRANKLMEQVHNKRKRMPLILPEDLAWEWIQEGLSPERIRQLCGYQYPSEKMHAYTIHKDFRQSMDPTAAYAYAELPPLV